MSQKHFVSAQALLEDSFSLAAQIDQANSHPDLIIGVWRGGTPIALAVHEYFSYRGIHAEHGCVTARSYAPNNTQSEVQVSALEWLHPMAHHAKNVLLVDDIFDTGRTLQALLPALQAALPNASIKVACVWFKPKRNKTQRTPDFFVHTTDAWVVFPHELTSLTAQEISTHKPLSAHTVLLD